MLAFLLCCLSAPCASLRPTPRGGGGPSPAALARAMEKFNTRLDAGANATLAPLLMDKPYDELGEADFDEASAMTERRQAAATTTTTTPARGFEWHDQRKHPGRVQRAPRETLQQRMEREREVELRRGEKVVPRRDLEPVDATATRRASKRKRPARKSGPERLAEWLIRKAEEVGYDE